MSTDDRDLGWLLDRLANGTPGIRHVLVLSKDGLKICYTPELDEDRADQLAALASGIQSLAVSAAAEFGHTARSGQSMVEFHGGVLLIVPAGEGSHLAVIAADESDVGLIGHTMNQLVDRVGDRVTAPPLRRHGGVGQP